MSSDRIYIVGFMGSGKTTAGEKLSAILGWKFIDLDKEVENKMGMTIPRIFSELGEDQFRKAETDSLRETVHYKDIVVSTGGGAPCHDDNMDFMLASGITVYLRLTPEQLRTRLAGSKTERPLIKGLGEDELLDFIRNKLSLREEFYLKAQIIMEDCELDIERLGELVRERIS